MPNRWGGGRGGRPWRRLVEAVKLRDQYTCQSCQRVTDQGECDHITPCSKGGKDDMGNLQWLCGPCHEAKTLREMGAKPKQAIGADGWPVHHGALGDRAYTTTSRLGASSNQHGASVNQVNRNGQ